MTSRATPRLRTLWNSRRAPSFASRDGYTCQNWWNSVSSTGGAGSATVAAAASGGAAGSIDAAGAAANSSFFKIESPGGACIYTSPFSSWFLQGFTFLGSGFLEQEFRFSGQE